jgi:salicylate hydroxylase
VGADGVNSKCREIVLGRENKPRLTGDMAYRILLDTKDSVGDGELRAFVEDPQVNYWMGPDKHAGTC